MPDTSARTLKYHVIRTDSRVTHTIEIPSTDEGIDMLDEIRRAFLHRGYKTDADRMEEAILAHRLRADVQRRADMRQRRKRTVKLKP